MVVLKHCTFSGVVLILVEIDVGTVLVTLGEIDAGTDATTLGRADILIRVEDGSHRPVSANLEGVLKEGATIIVGSVGHSRFLGGDCS